MAVMFTGMIQLLMLGMLGVMLAVVVYASWRATSRWSVSRTGHGKNPRLAVILFFGTYAALYLVVVSFPADLQNKGGFTNLVGHGEGFFSGMAIHYWQT